MADESDDDDQYKSLRAVWLEMRDEAPPQRGLDALMAAAHSQAKMMAVAKPPWWKWFVRPPVLAFATLMLLVGGVWIVMRHDDKVLEPSTEDTTPAAAPTAPISPTVQHGEVAPEEKAAPPRTVNPTSRGHVMPEHVKQLQKAPAAGTLGMAPDQNDQAAAPATDENRRINVDQLEHQVEAAAARNDCEIAKAIAARIAKQDSAYYRDHTAAAIKPCI